VFSLGAHVHRYDYRVSSAQAFLREFHKRHAGVTSATLAHGRIAGNGSSYDLLAADLRHRSPQAILDVACGDGFLLELLAKHFPDARLFGIDVSEDELRLAQRRLGSRAELRLGDAEGMPYADASFDAVTCHLAFMLVDDARRVAREIFRVLRGDGVFSAIVSGGGAVSRESVLGAFIMKLQALEAALPPLSLGDVKIETIEGLRDILSAFASVDVQEVFLQLDGAPDLVSAALMSMYNVHRLHAEARSDLEGMLRLKMREVRRDDGIVPCAFPMRHVVATKV
jgi:SAM-dependent methyltransferase